MLDICDFENTNLIVIANMNRTFLIYKIYCENLNKFLKIICVIIKYSISKNHPQ